MVDAPFVKAAVKFDARFGTRDDDVLLASFAKTGTTWLKALTFCCILHRDNSLLSVEKENPHFLVPTVEAVDSTRRAPPFDPYDASPSAPPCLLHTHLSHVLLPEPISCKIIYVARNPKDTAVSTWHFNNSFKTKKGRDPLPLEMFVDCFCSGVHLHGPFVEHVADYWEESKKSPEKILFLKYEDLKEDPKREVMKIAEFSGEAI